MTLLTRARISAIGAAGALARSVGTTLRRLEEERVVEQPPEAAKTAADGGGGEVQPLGRATDIPLLQHHFVEHQEIEIGT